jgi:1-phosphofructokinase/tagatose 6-phosphate kinase
VSHFLVVGLNPTLQNTFSFETLGLGRVNRAESHRLDASGKGINMARILVELGEEVVHLSQAGGRHLSLYRTLCAEDRVPIRYVECEVEMRYCHTLLDRSAHSSTEIVEAGHPVTPRIEADVLALYRELIADAHTMIIGGSKAPGFSPALYPEMVRLASEAGVRSVIDVRGDDLLGCIPHGPSVVKINVSEFSQTFDPDRTLPEDVDPDDIPPHLFEQMLELRASHGIDVVLTNGGNPVVFATDNGVESIAPRAVTPVNAIGCGDAVTAGLAAGLHRGQSLREAVLLGMDCAWRNVQSEKPGTIR